MDNIPKNLRTPTATLAAVCIVSAVISVATLRANNQHMITLRDAVYAADKNDGDVNGALNNLRNDVYAHMNTSLSSGGNAIKPPIQLKYTYNRLIADQQKGADAKNTRIYTDAEHYCQRQDSVDFFGGPRVPCVTQYVTSHGGTITPDIPVALYEFDFVSPTWSPDLAGWSLVVTALSFIGFLGTSVHDRLFRRKK